MDNLCHSLVGMALGRAGLARRGPLAMSTLVIANNLPDVDVAVFATNTLAMSFRRGWTHGVLAQLTLPIVLTGAMLAYDRYFPNKSSPADRASAAQLLFLSYVGVLLHVFMDFTNSYGVRLLMPFSNRWFYGDALYIVDPWLYLSLGLGWWLAKTRPRPARIGVTLATIYVAVMLMSNVIARREVADGLARAGRPDTRFMVTPVFLNPLRREVVIDVGDRYEKGNLWFDPRPHFRPAGFGMVKSLDQPDVQPALQSPRARAYLGWSRFPFVQVDPSGALWLNDYRYANAGPYGWSALKLK
jgi:inner membrane protein